MSKLNELRATLQQLKLLGLPISSEQTEALEKEEDNYIDEEIVPKIKEVITGSFNQIEHKTKIVIDYNGDPQSDPDVYIEKVPKPSADHNTPDLFGNKSYDKPRNTHLRVTMPDGRIIEGRGFNVLKDVVNEVGPDLVHEMDITCCGLPLVDDHRNDGYYSRAQKELNGRYWLFTNTSNDVKKQQIERINNELDLGMKVELVNANGDVVKVPPRNGTVRSSRQKMRIITPEGDVFFNNIQWKTLGQVILYAGAERVKEMNFLSAGMPLVSNHLFSNNNYVQYQHEIAPNVFLFNYSDTKKKAEIIQTISDKLNLNLKIELK